MVKSKKLFGGSRKLKNKSQRLQKKQKTKNNSGKKSPYSSKHVRIKIAKAEKYAKSSKSVKSKTNNSK